METTGAKAGSGDDAAPAADQERNQPGVPEESLTDTVKLCTNCVHHYEAMVGLGVYVNTCDRFKLVDVVDGGRLYLKCATQRASDKPDACGPTGRFFEAAPEGEAA